MRFSNFTCFYLVLVYWDRLGLTVGFGFCQWVISPVWKQLQQKQSIAFPAFSSMTAFLQETQFVHNLAQNLLQAKHTHYHQDFIKNRVLDLPNMAVSNFSVLNKFNQKIIASLFYQRTTLTNPCTPNPNQNHNHNHNQNQNQNQDTLRDSFKLQEGMEIQRGCVVYLHGFGSHRMEGAAILEALGKTEWDLCCFDFSGSGKSQGNVTAYGIKERHDIPPILTTLQNKYNYKKFILWGRSMGATASILHTSLASSQRFPILFQVLDSPFNSFQQIAIHHALQTYRLPSIFINAGINILKEYFKNHEHDPFQINASAAIKDCRTPALFVYCEDDNVIPSSHSLDIIAGIEAREHKTNKVDGILELNSSKRAGSRPKDHNTPISPHSQQQPLLYEKLLIGENHNNFRTKQTLEKILQTIRKYTLSNKVKTKVTYKKGLQEICSIAQPHKYKYLSIQKYMGSFNTSSPVHRANSNAYRGSLETAEANAGKYGGNEQAEVKIKRLSGNSMVTKGRGSVKQDGEGDRESDKNVTEWVQPHMNKGYHEASQQNFNISLRKIKVNPLYCSVLYPTSPTPEHRPQKQCQPHPQSQPHIQSQGVGKKSSAQFLHSFPIQKIPISPHSSKVIPKAGLHFFKDIPSTHHQAPNNITYSNANESLRQSQQQEATENNQEIREMRKDKEKVKGRERDSLRKIQMLKDSFKSKQLDFVMEREPQAEIQQVKTESQQPTSISNNQATPSPTPERKDIHSRRSPIKSQSNPEMEESRNVTCGIFFNSCKKFSNTLDYN